MMECLHGNRRQVRPQKKAHFGFLGKSLVVNLFVRKTRAIHLRKPSQPGETPMSNSRFSKHIVDPMQTRFAEELHQKSGVPLGPCGLDEVKRFQTYLSEYQINVVSKEYMSSIIYTGPEQEKRIYLYMHNNHYDVINKMPGFLH